MHNVWLIAKREYLERIRTKSFLLMTVLIPMLMVGGGLLNEISIAKSKSEAHIAIVSEDTQLALDLQRELENAKNSRMTVDVISPPVANTRPELNGELADKALDGYLWMNSASSFAGRPSFSYRGRSKGDSATERAINSALHTVLLREQLAHKGIVSSDVDSLLEPVKIESSGSNTVSPEIVAGAMFFMMYFAVMLYGMNVARSIIEEKTSRIFEVLLATIRPEEILAGKILGVGSVGLTQVFIWIATGLVLASTSLIASFAGPGAHVAISAAQIVFFFVYFILGFLLYASVAAALGAMVNSEQELQQLNMFLVMPLAACLFSMGVVFDTPGGTFSTIVSLIPFCSPLIMYMRISIAMPPAWQIALSLVLMAATIYAVLWIASRIYRVGILMYGKKPNLPEILRWLKYS